MMLTRMPDGSFQMAQADTAKPLEGTAADPHAPDAAASGAHAATGAQGGHKGSFPPFSPQHYASSLIWLAITFGALYFILSRYALPRIGAILAERRARIDGDLNEANRMKAESDAAIAAYEQALSDARARAQKTAAEAREAAAREAETARKALESQLADRIAAAEASILDTKNTALGSVRGIASEAAAEIVQHLTGTAPTPAELEQAVDAAMSRRNAA